MSSSKRWLFTLPAEKVHTVMWALLGLQGLRFQQADNGTRSGWDCELHILVSVWSLTVVTGLKSKECLGIRELLTAWAQTAFLYTHKTHIVTKLKSAETSHH